MDKKLRAAVAAAVGRCLTDLAGGSGHMASYSLVGDLQVTGRRDLGEGLTEYDFSVEAVLETEFTVYGMGNDPEPTTISGSIVLDETMALTWDDEGYARIKPWKCRKAET